MCVYIYISFTASSRSKVLNQWEINNMIQYDWNWIYLNQVNPRIQCCHTREVIRSVGTWFWAFFASLVQHMQATVGPHGLFMINSDLKHQHARFPISSNSRSSWFCGQSSQQPAMGNDAQIATSLLQGWKNTSMKRKGWWCVAEHGQNDLTTKESVGGRRSWVWSSVVYKRPNINRL